MPSSLIPMVALAPVLLAVAYFDLRFMRIPNWLSMVALAVILTALWFAPPGDTLARVTVASGVFALGILAFAFRLVGGGDVKILFPLLLAVPFEGLSLFANVFSVSLLAGIALVLGMRRIPQLGRLGWKSFGGSHKFPMGISIALAGLGFPPLALFWVGAA